MMRQENRDGTDVANGYYITEEPVFLGGFRGAGGTERYSIHGLLTMETRVGLALAVMLAMAPSRVREKRAGPMRSLVRAA